MPHQHRLGNPQALDLAAYPPSLVQVGEDEVLRMTIPSGRRRLAKAGRHAELEVYLKRWHVFQVHGAGLPGAQAALVRQVEFMFQHWAR